MKFNYESVLAQHNLKEEELSHKLKATIKQTKKIVEGIAAEQENLKNIKSDKAQDAAKKRIEHAELLVKDQDQQICEQIEKFVKNREVNMKRSENLKTARAKRANGGKANNPTPGGDPTPAPDPVPAPVADPVPTPAPKNDPVPNPKNDPTPTPSDKKESKGGLWWILGGVAAVALAAIGINVYNNRK